MQTTIDGLVLRAKAFEENRILTILTAQQGLVTAFANKAGNARKGLAASTEALSYSRFVLFSHRGRTVADKADANRIFFGIRQDYSKLCLASYFAQLAGELLAADEPAPEPLRLLLNCLHYLEEGSREPHLLKPLFELRLLTLTGFMPDLVGCRFCGLHEADEVRFFPQEGDIACGQCLTQNSPPGGIGLSASTLAAMRYIIYSPVERLFSFTLAQPGLDALSRISEQYLLSKAERSFPALELYRSISQTASPSKSPADI